MGRKVPQVSCTDTSPTFLPRVSLRQRRRRRIIATEERRRSGGIFLPPPLSLSLSCGNLLQYISPPFSCPHHHFFLASGGKATLSTAGVSPTNRPPSLPLFPRDRSPPPSPRFVSFDVILHCPTLRPLLFRPPPHQQSHSLGICPKVK